MGNNFVENVDGTFKLNHNDDNRTFTEFKNVINFTVEKASI